MNTPCFAEYVSITSRVKMRASALDAAHNEVQSFPPMVAVALLAFRGLSPRLSHRVLVGLGLIWPGCGPPT